ncbi:hypothetical protein WA026_022930 [Henosepilachna vigintioctopunctata]|uniref:Uncharacterized protein n=1 Tax=Henosepilachna vigintioctopunctata TaxID=420089 RepID=A0AAW1TT75_9CUCU
MAKTHSFIANMQKELFVLKKENLSLGEVVINCNFAENYSFVIQDEVLSFHWTSTQATIHPFIIYYKWENKLKYLQYIFISDCLGHNTTSFYVFQNKLISILKENRKSTFWSEENNLLFRW